MTTPPCSTILKLSLYVNLTRCRTKGERRVTNQTKDDYSDHVTIFYFWEVQVLDCLYHDIHFLAPSFFKWQPCYKFQLSEALEIPFCWKCVTEMPGQSCAHSWVHTFVLLSNCPFKYLPILAGNLCSSRPLQVICIWHMLSSFLRNSQ